MQKGDKRYNNLRSAFFPLQKWRDVGRGSRFAPLQPQHFRYVSNQPYWLRPFSFTTTVGFVYPFVHSRLMKGKAPFGSNNPIYSCFLSTGSGRFIMHLHSSTFHIFLSGMPSETRQIPEDDDAVSAPSGITKVYSSGYNDQIWQFDFNAATGHITPGKRMQVRYGGSDPFCCSLIALRGFLIREVLFFLYASTLLSQSILN